MFPRLLNLILLLFVFSNLLPGQDNPIQYSFFVAGHTYGTPGVDNVGLHPPFKEKFDYIRNRSEIQLGFLTGDIVWQSSAEDWDEVDVDINSLGIPVFFAAGNHDLGDLDLYESRYGDTYYSFIQNNDLFLVLNPNLDHWNISADQIVFIRKILDEQAAFVDNVFVFFHQMLWWTPYNIYRDLKSNSLEGRAFEINFWSDVEPLFKALNNQVYMFAGDIGAGSWASDVAYDQYENISFIASGMGEGVGDNFVVVNIHTDKSISYDLICLNDPDPDCLGQLIDYKLSTGILEINELEEIKLYPNPVTDWLTIESSFRSDWKIELFDLTGHQIHHAAYTGSDHPQIFLGSLPKGIYFLKIRSERTSGNWKIIR